MAASFASGQAEQPPLGQDRGNQFVVDDHLALGQQGGFDPAFAVGSAGLGMNPGYLIGDHDPANRSGGQRLPPLPQKGGSVHSSDSAGRPPGMSECDQPFDDRDPPFGDTTACASNNSRRRE
ncbi:hypothetical protein [Nocardia gamkensis]|uniref:Uncharacterized protein n=1 Tax=Nocardia gamkensis TaxID=352869 RepID=A0A7X6LBB8_9NOCA|nr:hypothetical protein [Nocardia gamkensis]NKY31317.1 hypothetical protein [Nocardia gamkensis]